MLRGRFQRRDNHLLHLFSGDRGPTPRSRLIDQTVQPRLYEPGPPLTDRWHRNPQLRSDFFVRQTGRTGQYDPRSQRQSLRRFPPSNPPSQLLGFIRCQLQQGFRPSCHTQIPTYDNEIAAQDTGILHPGRGRVHRRPGRRGHVRGRRVGQPRTAGGVERSRRRPVGRAHRRRAGAAAARGQRQRPADALVQHP
jgi:hypothetical protein